MADTSHSWHPCIRLSCFARGRMAASPTPTVVCLGLGRRTPRPRGGSVSPHSTPLPGAMAVPLRESVGKGVFPHDGRTADEKPGNVPPYADDGHRYPLSSFSHDGIAMVRKPGVIMPAFSALPHRATLSLVLSRNEPLMPSHPIQRQAHSACASCSL